MAFNKKYYTQIYGELVTTVSSMSGIPHRYIHPGPTEAQKKAHRDRNSKDAAQAMSNALWFVTQQRWLELD